MSVSRENKEALNVTDNTKNIIFKRVNEKVLIQEMPHIISYNSYGDSFILDHNTNGILSTADSVDGNQILLGSQNRINTIQKIVNSNNNFYELFCDDELKISTDGTWDTTNKRLVLADGEEAEGYYFANVVNITNSTMIVQGEIDNAILYLSSNDGTNYEQVTNNTKHGFTNVGQVGKWKLVASGDTVTATQIRIQYNS